MSAQAHPPSRWAMYDDIARRERKAGHLETARWAEAMRDRQTDGPGITSIMDLFNGFQNEG